MKLLTSITIIIAIPTFIASMWGMNVSVPFRDEPLGFWLVFSIIVLVTIVCMIFLYRKKII